jgi:hypothetical protein
MFELSSEKNSENGSMLILGNISYFGVYFLMTGLESPESGFDHLHSK